MILLAAFTAAADAICPPAILEGFFPIDTATDVPTDVAPYLHFSGFCTEGDFTFAITEQSGGTEVFTTLIEATALDGPLDSLLYDGAPLSLSPDTTYEASVSNLLDSWSWSFSTGADVSVPLNAADIVLSIDSAQGSTVDQLHYVDTSFSVTVPHSLPVILTYDDREIIALAPGTDRSSTTVVAPGGEFCLTPIARDIDGSWIEGEKACAQVVEATSPTGCSTTGTVGLWGRLLVPLFARRR